MPFDNLEVVSLDMAKGLIATAPGGTKTEVARRIGHTVYIHNVTDPAKGLGKTENILKPAKANGKISGELVSGPWRGKAYTLTLEERATCSQSCNHWADCYGNNMPFARRYVVNAAFYARVELELGKLQADLDRKNAKRAKDGLEPLVFAVRWHVLGDAPSVEYVETWRKWFAMFPSLRVWGYSHWHPGTAIGDAILKLREDLGGLKAKDGGKFCVRFSDYPEDGPAALAADTPSAKQALADGTAIICPEQTQSKDRKESAQAITCGTCALCWTCRKHVVFISH